MPTGSSRTLRLDPFTLPVRFVARDQGADERIRSVELHRERVVLRRAIRGMRMAVNLPVSSYLGVAIRLFPPEQDSSAAVGVILEHSDPALSVPLFVAASTDDIMAEWQSWGRVLQLPLLVAEADGTLREPFARIGRLRVAQATQRRRRHGALKHRRPSILLRRRAGKLPACPRVHRGEDEIIARD
jgi:hypothetical protein